jgi:hypothetical protein
MNNMATGYGKKKEPDKYDAQETPFGELCLFSDHYGLHVEIEKPFKEMENLFVKVIDQQTGEEVYRSAIDDISVLNEEASRILNNLSQKAF